MTHAWLLAVVLLAVDGGAAAPGKTLFGDGGVVRLDLSRHVDEVLAARQQSGHPVAAHGDHGGGKDRGVPGPGRWEPGGGVPAQGGVARPAGGGARAALIGHVETELRERMDEVLGEVGSRTSLSLRRLLLDEPA